MIWSVIGLVYFVSIWLTVEEILRISGGNAVLSENIALNALLWTGMAIFSPLFLPMILYRRMTRHHWSENSRIVRFLQILCGILFCAIWIFVIIVAIATARPPDEDEEDQPNQVST